MQNQIAAKVLLFFGICKRLSIFCRLFIVVNSVFLRVGCFSDCYQKKKKNRLPRYEEVYFYILVS